MHLLALRFLVRHEAMQIELRTAVQVEEFIDVQDLHSNSSRSYHGERSQTERGDLQLSRLLLRLRRISLRLSQTLSSQ
jgi:hypothetical protein